MSTVVYPSFLWENILMNGHSGRLEYTFPFSEQLGKIAPANEKTALGNDTPSAASLGTWHKMRRHFHPLSVCYGFSKEKKKTLHPRFGAQYRTCLDIGHS